MNPHFTRILTLAPAVIACLLLGAPQKSQAQVGVMITVGPPPLPIYEQPLCPGDGYIWTPGYWAYGDDFDDYYWVPGTWILAPEVGFFWTPGYWSWGGDRFVFYDGYWGPQVGFYGGINYGFGYFGEGYQGGRWDNGHFFYNRSVNNVNVTEIHNVYNATVNNTTENRVSFNGGKGGITARPTPQQQAAQRERHIPPVAAQTQQMQAARGDQQLRASVNHGKPYVAATARPGDFKGSAVASKEAGGAYNPPASRGISRGANQPANNNDSHSENRPETGGSENQSQENSAGHVRDLPPAEKPPAPNTGDPDLDKKYQQEQDKQYAQQQDERQKLAQQQEKEDATVANQKANDAQKQQLEQRHQQQTQDLQQRHQHQQQQMQQRMQPPPREPQRSTPPK